MAGIQLSGLASGFDWKSVVDQLIALERTPQTKLSTEKSTNTSKVSALATLRTKLTAFQEAASALSSTSLFGQRAVSQSNEDLNWTASTSSGTAKGSYVFNVSKLATQSVRQGVAGVAASLNDSDDVDDLLISEMRLSVPIKQGTFTVNGSAVTVGSADTLGDVFDKISTATGGTVSAAYDTESDRVTLTSSGGPITLGGGGDTSNFLFALKLYNGNNPTSITSSSTLGSIGLRDTIAEAGLETPVTAVNGAGAGTFTLNGVSIAYNVNSDSIQTIMSRVNASEAGATMTYDAATDRFTLTNKATGDMGVVVSEGAGGLLAALNLNGGAVVTRGSNAEFTVNGGGTIITSSNALDAGAHGISGLTVNATSTGSQTIAVANDTSAIETGIKNFITKYNDIQSYVDSQTRVTVGTDGKVTTGLMAGNREFTDIARQLRTNAFSAVTGASADLSRLESIGIDFEGSSTQLSVRDSAKLTEALASNLDKVSALFTTSTTGISARVSSYISKLTVTGGSVDTQTKSMERQNTSIDKQIADIERRLTAERERLEASFIAMEEAQSKMSSQLASLNNILK